MEYDIPGLPCKKDREKAVYADMEGRGCVCRSTHTPHECPLHGADNWTDHNWAHAIDYCNTKDRLFPEIKQEMERQGRIIGKEMAKGWIAAMKEVMSEESNRDEEAVRPDRGDEG